MHSFQDQKVGVGDESTAESQLSREHGHAFKNIFSIIIANAEMIGEEGGGADGPVHRRLERIIAACHRGEQLVATIQSQKTLSLFTPVPVATTGKEAVPVGPLHGRILVVDDEPDVVEIVRRYLIKEGLEIHGLSNPLEAIEHLSKESSSYDLVLTDLDMPYCSGTELCRRLQGLCPELPLIVMTGYGRSLTPREMDHCRIRALLCKPIDRRLLLATIRRYLST
ncbi:MAG: response regulator [Desulfobulbus sp.]|nr:response regulator [Desulfobulbus sp.]